MADLILKDEAYRVIGCCFEVHNALGPGFLEAVYQEALELELASQGVAFRAQPELSIRFKGRLLNKTYQPDFICFDQIVVEIKAVSELSDAHRAQTINYLRASGHPLGLLVNFGSIGKLQYERIALTRERS